jgi:hypothetical protein
VEREVEGDKRREWGQWGEEEEGGRGVCESGAKDADLLGGKKGESCGGEGGGGAWWGCDAHASYLLSCNSCQRCTSKSFRTPLRPTSCDARPRASCFIIAIVCFSLRQVRRLATPAPPRRPPRTRQMQRRWLASCTRAMNL